MLRLPLPRRSRRGRLSRCTAANSCAAKSLAGVGLSIWLSRSITQPLSRAVEVAEAIARFDLTSRIDQTNARGELIDISALDMVEAGGLLNQLRQRLNTPA